MKPKTRADFETDYQYESYLALLKASEKFKKAVVTYREAFPFTTWKGDAYILGGWLAGIFDIEKRDDALIAIGNGYHDACEKLKEKNE